MPKRIWLDRVSSDIKEKGLSSEEMSGYKAVLIEDVYRRTSIPHK